MNLNFDMNLENLFKRFFGKKSKLILSDTELTLASIVYDLACNEIHKVANSGLEYDDVELSSFEDKVVAAEKNFEKIVELFQKTKEAKNDFLKNFDRWSSIRKSNIWRLKAFAEKIQTDKFNSDISKVVGGVVGTVGGILVLPTFFTPLAAVTVPLAIGGGVTALSGTSVIAGTVGIEIFLLKKELKKVKYLVEEEQRDFSSMANWFCHSKELKEALESLAGSDLLNELAEVVQKYLGEVTNINQFMLGNGKKKFVVVLKLCVWILGMSIRKETRVSAITPAIITFLIMVCLLRVHNRNMLQFVETTHRLTFYFINAVNIGVETSHMIIALTAKHAHVIGNFPPAAMAGVVFVALSIAINILNVIISSKDIHIRAESKYTANVKEVADKLEKEFIFIEKVYNELKNKGL